MKRLLFVRPGTRQEHFQYCNKNEEKDPQWYSDVAEFVKEAEPDGTWSSNCGEVPDTAFCVLFFGADEEEHRHVLPRK